MKVSIEEISKDKFEEVIIRCYEVNDEIIKLLNKLKIDKLELLGYDKDSIYRLKLQDVYYFEAVDNKVFIYYKNQVFESKQRLYELEELIIGKKFFRASKSTIINLTKISYVKPSISGRFEAKMENGENVVISRQYVPILKDLLGL